MKFQTLWALLLISLCTFGLAAITSPAIASDTKLSHEAVQSISMAQEADACGPNRVFVQSGSDAVVIEAENFTRNSGAVAGHDWLPNASFGDLAGNGIVMSALPNTGLTTGLETTGASLEYDVQFETPGQYFLYIRGIADNDPRRQQNDSLHFGVDGNPITADSGLGFTGITEEALNWKNRANGWNRVEFDIDSAGLHTLNLWMREDGLSIDRIVVSMDRNFDISLPDIGPVETACIPNNPPSETAIAWDMVNSTSSNLISFSTDAAAFLSPADCFGKAQREVSTTIPFGVLDDSLTIFPDDDQGIIGESNTEEFFCIVDTINDQNQGVLSAEWQFNITGATDLSLSLDAGAMGNFETTDQFQWAYQIDGNPAVTFLSSTVDLEQENTYILDDGDAFTLEDVMLANGVLLDNHLQTFTEVISGTGSIMTLVLSATVNADIDAIAFQNLIINGTGMVVDPPPPPPPPMLGLQITEIMYNPASLEPDWEWIEVYNTGNVSVDLAGAVLDDGDAVTVSASNIAEGVIEPGQAGILYNTDLIAGPDFEAAWGDVNLIAVTEWENINLNNDGDTIALWLSFAAYDGDVQTQANAITAVTYDVGGEWPIGTGFASIYLTDLDADPSNPLNWSLSEAGVETPVSTAFVSNFAGGNGGLDIGSPAPSAIEPLAASLLITEIMYNPAAPEPDWEWVEVYNSGNVMLDLAGYVIDDNNSVTMELANIGPGMLGPGESAVLYNADAVTAEDFAAAWGTVNLIPVTNWGDMSLDNSGDTVSIWDSTDAYFADLADETEATQPFATVAFDDSGDWPEDNDFASIYLTALDADPALGASWATSVDGIATPVNDTYTSTISAENVGQDLGSPGIPAP